MRCISITDIIPHFVRLFRTTYTHLIVGCVTQQCSHLQVFLTFSLLIIMLSSDIDALARTSDFFFIISAPIGAWEVKRETMTDRETDRPTDRRHMRAHREVSLPISAPAIDRRSITNIMDGQTNKIIWSGRHSLKFEDLVKEHGRDDMPLLFSKLSVLFQKWLYLY